MINQIIILLVVAFSTLTGCSYIKNPSIHYKNRDSAYLNATTIAPMKIPPGISSPPFSSHYSVSDNNLGDEVKPVNIDPLALTSST
jgi:uncharacterized lipoprotein